MLYDKNFLKDLMESRFRTVYARITSLSMDEIPQERIEGKVTQGSINIDGKSAVRRTCSLTMISEDKQINNYYWSLNTKFKLEIGVGNILNSSYPDIIWFNYGVYVINNFSASMNVNSCTISINGKDKMCFLNGELGGSFPSQIDFGIMESGTGTYDDEGNEILKKIHIHIKDIVREAVHTYGNEPFHNIIINDIEEYGLELQEYRYDKPLYLWRKTDKDTYENGTLDDTIECKFDGNTYMLKELQNIGFIFDPLTDLIDVTPSAAEIDGEDYYLAKIDYGETAGYKQIDLIYPSDLILNAGESITTLLDKIKNFLGEFEYFYNVDGQFVFQKKKTYVDTPWDPFGEGGDIDASLQNDDQYIYKFTDSRLFTSINLTPNISNLRNDYCVWGKNNSDNPIHMRYAIHKKPFIYTSIAVSDAELSVYNEKYGTNLKGQESKTYILQDGVIDENTYHYYDGGLYFFDQKITGTAEGTELTINQPLIFSEEEVPTEPEDKIKISISNNQNLIVPVLDWRELIYQMALDYSKYNHLDDFEVRVVTANNFPEEGETEEERQRVQVITTVLNLLGRQLYPNGKTQYEQYYTDMLGFWRLLYNPDDHPNLGQIELYEKTLKALPRDANGEIIPGEESKKIISEVEYLNPDFIYYTYDADNEKFVQSEKFGWSRNVVEDPAHLLFWIDFLDYTGMEKYSISKIGVRSKVVNDNDVKTINYQDTPGIIFISSEDEKKFSGYKYFQIPSMENMFSKAVQGKTAKESIDNLLYTHGYCADAISISSIPIYQLDANTRIYINDQNSGIVGDYIINSLSIPLAYNGMMSISANKAPKYLY